MDQNGLGIPAEDPQRAIKMFQKACDADDSEACKNLGVSYFYGKGVEPDYERAAAANAKACDRSEYVACANLGLALMEGKGVSVDRAKAIEHFERACENGVDSTCRRAAFALEVDGETERAQGLFDKACDSAVGCYNLGIDFYTGKLGVKDIKRAAMYFERGCERGQASSCSNFALLLRDGVGVEKDKERSMQMFKKACDAGNEDACNIVKTGK